MPQSPGAKRQISRMQRAMGAPFLLWGGLILILGLTIYLLGVLLSIVRLLIPLGPSAEEWIQSIIWYSGVPTTVGLLLCLIDLIFMLGRKRKCPRWVEGNEGGELQRSTLTVVLTAYNDEEGIAASVADFRNHPLVERVIVVSNNSSDRTAERAAEAGGIVY